MHSDEPNLIIKPNEIILNGVKYVPDISIPNKVSIYLMKDNHSTIKIEGTTPKKILLNIKKAKLSDPDASIGSIFLMHDKKEVTRYNISVKDLGYIEELLNREDIYRILNTNGI